jgi:pyruvate/2-oxoglutarate dehydrogenase complex dihydrolipoamide dehydrogenase (E3) component
VLGTGSAAQTVAYACRSAGWRVAVVDSRPFGGTCENRGCEPKKVEEVINLFALAIRAGQRSSDLKQMIYAYPTSASDVSYMF